MIIPFAALIGAAVILRLLLGSSSQKGKGKRKSQSSPNAKYPARTSLKRRSDAIILKSKASQLSAGEFERLLVLYFLNQGYKVDELLEWLILQSKFKSWKAWQGQWN